MENNTNKALRIRLTAFITVGAFLMLMCLLAWHIKNKEKKADNPVVPMTSDASESEPIAYVVIDPGHGGFDNGAQGISTGVLEDELNLKVSKLLAERLETQNIKVTLTRCEDEALADTKKEDMKERRRLMHDMGADITVSIHMNKFSDRAVHGPMVFYTDGDEMSERLAECVLSNICSALELPARRINTGDYYVIRNSRIPAIIVECGFLSNPTEERKLCDDSYQMRLADAVAKGIMEFINSSNA